MEKVRQKYIDVCIDFLHTLHKVTDVLPHLLHLCCLYCPLPHGLLPFLLFHVFLYFRPSGEVYTHGDADTIPSAPFHCQLVLLHWAPGWPPHLLLPSSVNGFYRVILGLLYVDHSFWNSLTFWLLYQMWALCSDPPGSKMPVAGVMGALESALRKRPTSLTSHNLCLSWVENLGFLGRHSLPMSSDKLKSESLHMRFTTCRTKLLAISRSQSENCSFVFDSLWPHGLYNPWNPPGQNTRVGSLSLLQGIFPTQGSNPGLLHCRQILYQLSHQGETQEYTGVGSLSFLWQMSLTQESTGVSCISGGFFINWAMREAPKAT